MGHAHPGGSSPVPGCGTGLLYASPAYGLFEAFVIFGVLSGGVLFPSLVLPAGHWVLSTPPGRTGSPSPLSWMFPVMNRPRMSRVVASPVRVRPPCLSVLGL